MPNQYIKKILEAPVYDVAVETPLEQAPFLSERLENNILVKREDLQPVFSFKIRGAYNKIVQLSEEERQKGVVCASAGNHAQGVAMASNKLGIRSVIVMPTTTPDIKVKAVRARGGEVVLHGDSFDQSLAFALDLEKREGLSFIHPYDDPDTIAGQGTIGMEILRQHTGPLDAIFIPVGGGGLIAGIAAYIKYLRPETRVIGVEYEESACLKAAMDAGERVVLSQVGLFADGVAVAQIGKETFRVCQKCVDEVITVSADEVCAAIKDLFEDTRSLTETAGAIATAGLKKYVERENIQNRTLVTIASGANINFDRLRYVAERADLGEGKEAILGVTIPERPGSFKHFCETIGRRNITEFNYRYFDNKKAHIFVGVQMHPETETRDKLVGELTEASYPVQDLTDNEMAKLHVRHMVGGHAPSVEDEVVYRFEFPERPGALLRFLQNIGNHWNISMFHYRNHGAAYGRVVVGMQVPENERSQIPEFLDKVGYHYWEESSNSVYELFLS